jgi:RecB family endonuclease NucS
MRPLVARCSGQNSGRLNAVLGESLRSIIFKSDDSVLVHADSVGYKPPNWMSLT